MRHQPCHAALLPATFAFVPAAGALHLLARLADPVRDRTGRFRVFPQQTAGSVAAEVITTEADLGNMRIVDIIPVRKGSPRHHEIIPTKVVE
jgi:hypothetical protein